MITAKLSQKNQIVIPKNVRTDLGLKAGSRIVITPLDSEYALIMKQPADVAGSMKGQGKDIWKKLGGTESYLKKERSSWKKSV